VAFLRRIISRESIAYERKQRPYDDPVTNRFVTQVLRAEYRLTFFCHGKSRYFNYALTSHMSRGICRGRSVKDTYQVLLRPLYDPEENFVYPLYSTKCPKNVLNAIKIVWLIRHVMKDWSDDYVRYVVVSLATWAYAECFSTVRKLDVDETCREMIRAYPRNFSVNFLLRRIVNFPGLAAVYVDKRLRPTERDVTRCVLSSGQPSIVSAVLMATLPRNVRHVIEEQFLNFVSNQVEIVPNSLIKPGMRIRYWSVVKTRRDGGVDAVAKAIRNAKRDSIYESDDSTVDSSLQSIVKTQQGNRVDINAIANVVRDAKRDSIHASPTRQPQSDDRTVDAVESSPLSIVSRTSDSPRIVVKYSQPRVYLKRLSPRTLARYSRPRVLLRRLTVLPTLRRSRRLQSIRDTFLSRFIAFQEIKRKPRGVHVSKRTPTIAAATHQICRKLEKTTSSGVSSFVSTPTTSGTKEGIKSTIVSRQLTESYDDGVAGPSTVSSHPPSPLFDVSEPSPPLPPSRRGGATIVEMHTITQRHYIAIINEAMRTRSLDNVDVWRRLRLNNLDLFFNFTVDAIRNQAYQLAHRLVDRQFLEDHCLALIAMREMLLKNL